MKLTKREIELIADIETSRNRRRRAAWVGLIIVLASSFALSYFNWFAGSSSTLIGVLLGAAIVNLLNAYSTIRVDDKLNDVLQRYVNSDPDAVRQLASVGRKDDPETRELKA